MSADPADVIMRDGDIVPGFAPAPPAPEPETLVWEPVSIADADAEAVAKPTRMNGMVYDDAVTLVSGEPGVGKSMFLAAVVAEEAIAGRRPLYLDFEGRPGTLLERLEKAGLSDEQLARVLYRRPGEQATPDEIRAMVARVAPNLVALDSYDAALAAFNLETKNEDIRAFNRLVVEPLRSAGASLVIADHVAKDREKRGPYSIGGQSKLAIVDAHIGLTAIAPLRRGSVGKLKVREHKDRHGWLPRSTVFELRSHETTGALSWNVTADLADTVDDGWLPTNLMEQISRFLEERTEPCSRETVVTEGARGKSTDYKRQALDALVASGYVSETTGTRNARLYQSVKPFREEEADRAA